MIVRWPSLYSVFAAHPTARRFFPRPPSSPARSEQRTGTARKGLGRLGVSALAVPIFLKSRDRPGRDAGFAWTPKGPLCVCGPIHFHKKVYIWFIIDISIKGFWASVRVGFAHPRAKTQQKYANLCIGASFANGVGLVVLGAHFSRARVRRDRPRGGPALAGGQKSFVSGPIANQTWPIFYEKLVARL